MGHFFARNLRFCLRLIQAAANVWQNMKVYHKIICYSGTPPYDHPVYKTTSLLRPYSFKPNVTTIESFYYFEDPVNATTSLLRPGFYGPTVVALTGFHCICKIFHPGLSSIRCFSKGKMSVQLFVETFLNY